MSKAKTIKIASARGKETNFILVTRFESVEKVGEMQYYHYQLTDLSTVNKTVDIGAWKIKKKKKYDNI
jgi:hypothetical protein